MNKCVIRNRDFWIQKDDREKDVGRADCQTICWSQPFSSSSSAHKRLRSQQQGRRSVQVRLFRLLNVPTVAFPRLGFSWYEHGFSVAQCRSTTSNR
jgi:hypothetical protein